MKWICEEYKYRKCKYRFKRYDVSINKTKCGCGLIFRNDYGANFDDGIDFAIDGDRLYFRNTNSGYKLQPTPNTDDIKHVYIKDNHNIKRFLVDFEGAYDLNYDVELGLYYVEKS